MTMLSSKDVVPVVGMRVQLNGLGATVPPEDLGPQVVNRVDGSSIYCKESNGKCRVRTYARETNQNGWWAMGHFLIFEASGSEAVAPVSAPPIAALTASYRRLEEAHAKMEIELGAQRTRIVEQQVIITELTLELRRARRSK